MNNLQASSRRRLAVALMAGVLVAAPGCDRGSGVAKKRPSEQQPTPVRLATVEWRPMERSVTALGTLRAIDRATLSIKITGRLKTLPVDVGSVVHAGDVVAQIEPRDYELRLKQSEAFLAQARARLGLSLAGDDDAVDLEKTSIVRQARALFEEASNNLVRIRQLETERISSLVELERAEAESVVTHNRLADSFQDAHERQAVLAQRRAEYEIARQQLADASLRAPFDGVVQERLTNVGEFLISGSPVMTLVQTDPLRLQADIPERESHRVRTGQVVRMTLEGDTNRYVGHLARVSPALDDRTRMLRVEAEFANPGHLRPGRFAHVDIIVEAAAPTLVIPAEALSTFAGTEKALVIVTNRAQERPLVCGRREGSWVEVVEGLKDGDRVIRDPGGLQNGDPVRPADGEPRRSS